MDKLADTVVHDVAETLIKASTIFRPDQIKCYQRALKNEVQPQARWVLQQILANAEAAAKNAYPLCDDTGIPHLWLEVGNEALLPVGFFGALVKGVAQGLKQLPGRPMAVKGNEKERIDQSAGLYAEPERLLPAPVVVSNIPGDRVKLSVLMYGGGPEIRGKTHRVFHRHSLQTVLNEMILWAIEGADKLGCLPCVLGFGIGRTNLEAASLSLEAMKDGQCLVQSDLEKEITNKVNSSDIGPLGLGGKTTVLATFIKVGPQRASGVRILSMRVGCCFDPRRAEHSWHFPGKPPHHHR